MNESEYPTIPEGPESVEDVELGWMPYESGVYRVRATVEQRRLSSLPHARRSAQLRTVNIFGNGWSQYVDWLVIRPYVLRSPGAALDGSQESLWPEDVGVVAQTIGVVQTSYYTRERGVCLDQLEVHSSGGKESEATLSALVDNLAAFLQSRYPNAQKLVASQDHSYLSVPDKAGFWLSQGFEKVLDHPMRFERMFRNGS